jgi:hypothetical protein
VRRQADLLESKSRFMRSTLSPFTLAAFAVLLLCRPASALRRHRLRRSSRRALPKKALFDPKLTDVAAPLVTDEKVVMGGAVTPEDPHMEERAPGMEGGGEGEEGGDSEKEGSGSGSESGTGSFAFFPATAAERKAAENAPADPHVEEALQDGQPWQPYIPHGIDLGATSQLTGDNFMAGGPDVSVEEDPFRAFNPHIQGRHTPPPLLGGAPYPRL